ncbi:MAG: tetratricopeptide repeat protein, partial [Bacteroidales bacterium]|nr:tetratricopeptide repeat protein [Bacteroidales bacterium]
MKSIIISGFLTFCLLLAAEAKPKKSEAKALFDKQQYALAIPVYEQDLKKAKTRTAQAQIETQIGICYYYLNKSREAVSWLRKGINKKYETAQIYAVYGLSLQKQEKYAEAKEAFQQCLKKDRRYPNIQLYIESCDYAANHPEANTQVKMRSSKLNTTGSEYGISPGVNEIFFSRASTKGKDIDPRTGLGFTEVWTATPEGGDLVKPKKEKEFMKTYFNTGIFAFDHKTNYMYMTMCDPKSGKCGIYRSKYNRKKWEKPEPFFVNSKYDMAHPSLAKGGSRLYFTSNSPGGKGKTDIWYVDKVDDDEWSNAKNAGEKVNTPGREEFPFVENDSILYFASEGHPGYGGLDIYAIAIEEGQFGDRINLGRPFNSGADDFNLITYGENGYLVSSRNVANSDDIFIFLKNEIP